MDQYSTQLLIAKMSALLLMSFLFTACGISVDEESEADAQSGKNRLVAMTEGSYAMQLNTTALTCHGFDDFEMRQMAYTHDADPTHPDDPDQGLDIDLWVFGDLDTGEALTADNSTESRYFKFALTTPTQELYEYSSLGTEGSSSLAVLTVLKATDFAFSTRLWIERLTPALERSGAPASFRGTFDCSLWEGDKD